MREIKRVLVYCASSSKIAPLYVEAAKAIGKKLAENKLELVYGAGSVGLMGVLADAVLEHGGVVKGVIPKFMVDVEWQHDGITELIQTETMHERKAKMAEMADAVIALPGGFGTMEELLEIITWKQLDIHKMPIVIANINGFYDKFLEFVTYAAQEQFVRTEHLDLWRVITKTEELMDALTDPGFQHHDMRRFAKI